MIVSPGLRAGTVVPAGMLEARRVEGRSPAGPRLLDSTRHKYGPRLGPRVSALTETDSLGH